MIPPAGDGLVKHLRFNSKAGLLAEVLRPYLDARRRTRDDEMVLDMLAYLAVSGKGTFNGLREGLQETLDRVAGPEVRLPSDKTVKRALRSFQENKER